MAATATRRVKLEYSPTQKQALFHASTEHELLYGGSAGGGKSKAMVMEAFMRCLEYPGYRAYLFRRTYKQLEDTLITEALASYPKGVGRYVGNDHAYKFNNGSLIRFRHCEHEADRYDYLGAEIHFLGIDEATQFTHTIYDYLKTRVRTTTVKNVPLSIRVASNPGGIGHGWVKAHFVDPHKHGGTHESVVWSDELQRHKRVTIGYIPATVFDNPHIGEDYVFELEQKPEALRRALLFGDWDVFEGQAFPEFVDDPKHYQDRTWTHVIDPFPIPADWKRFHSFDWGYAKPFSVGWWALAPNGRLYRTAEWYGAVHDRGGVGSDVGIKLSVREVARRIAQYERETMPGISVQGPADPSIFASDRGETIASIMEQEGVFFYPGDNARIAGKMQVHYRLQFDEHGYPGLQIFRNCRNCIRTLPTIPYNTRNVGQVEDIDTQSEDHIYDDMRYMLMDNPIAPKAPPLTEIRVANPLDMDVRVKRRMGG